MQGPTCFQDDHWAKQMGPIRTNVARRFPTLGFFRKLGVNLFHRGQGSANLKTRNVRVLPEENRPDSSRLNAV